MRRVAAAAILLLLMALPGQAAETGPRTLGLVVSGVAGASPMLPVRLADALLEALAANRQWDAVVLTATGPLVRASGVAWPEATDAKAPSADWRRLTEALRLDDVWLVNVHAAPVLGAEVAWFRPDQPGARSVSASVKGDEAQVVKLAVELVARLRAGFEAAAVIVPPTPGASPTPVAVTPATGGPVTVKPGEGTVAKPAANPGPGTGPEAALAPPTTSPSTPTPGATPTPSTDDRATAPTTALPTPAPTAPATAPTTPTPEAPATPAITPAPATPAPQPASPAAPAALSVHYAAAEQFIKEGELKKAEEAAVRAEAAGDPKAQISLLFARLQAARGNSSGERLWLERALTADPKLPEPRLRLAEILRLKGLWSKALDEYQTVLTHDAANLTAIVGQATIYGQHGQPKRAAELLAKAVADRPDDARLHLRLGDMQAQRGARAEAEGAYDKAIRLATAPEDKAVAFDRLGDLYVSAERYHEGFACYAEAAKLRGSDTSPLAEKRYAQVMAAGDEGLERVLGQTAKVFGAYLAGDGPVREETYRALADLRAQAQEVVGFMDAVASPAGLRAQHLRRKLAVSLVLEAAVSGMVYLDTGRAELLDTYRARLADARTSLQALRGKS